MKVCPKCRSTGLPDGAEQCPYCLFRFEMPQKPEIPPEAPKQNQQVHHSKDKFIIGPVILLLSIAIAVVLLIKSCSSGEEDTSAQIETTIESSPESSTDTVAETDIVTETEMITETEKDETPVAPISEEETIPYGEQYILPYSNSRYLTEADLRNLSAEELRLARNEIYARHGRLFKDSGLQDYFNSRDWYEGTISPDDFTDAYAASVFNEYEMANKDFIAQYEKRQ